MTQSKQKNYGFTAINKISRIGSHNNVMYIVAMLQLVNWSIIHVQYSTCTCIVMNYHTHANVIVTM